jgi:hypothetical protein
MKRLGNAAYHKLDENSFIFLSFQKMLEYVLLEVHIKHKYNLRTFRIECVIPYTLYWKTEKSVQFGTCVGW